MKLKDYFFALHKLERETFAKRCGTTTSHLQNISYGTRSPSTELAVLIEQTSDKAVTRQELFPWDFKAKWPELV